MRKIVLLRSKNRAATEYYYNIIKEAIVKASDFTEDVYEGEEFQAKRDDIIVVGSCLSFLRVWRKGYKNVITWFQGSLPEESYMRNHSTIRKKTLEFIERLSLKHSKLVIFVSEAMKDHYENYYHIKIKNYYVMPCFNTEFSMSETGNDGRYQTPTFTYVGGLSAWQCINETLALYKEIEKEFDFRCSLLILTPQKDEAEQLVIKAGITNYTIKTVHYTEIAGELHDVSFGFNLRQDNIVNRVATPTKLANYVANGVIPIVSSCVEDFVERSKSNPFIVVVHDMNDTGMVAKEIKRIIDTGIRYNEVYNACKDYFKDYYNVDYHIGRLTEKLTNEV